MLGVRQIASAAENGVEAAPGLLELPRPDIQHGQGVPGPDVIGIKAERVLVGRPRLLHSPSASVRGCLIKPFLEGAGLGARAASMTPT
jgi:hypothetical protein